jgi:hypothetical protein
LEAGGEVCRTQAQNSRQRKVRRRSPDSERVRPVVVNDAALLGLGTATLGRLVDRASGPG